MTLREKYPEAWEDEKGTIWISQPAAESADWTYEHGDAFLENVIGAGHTAGCGRELGDVPRAAMQAPCSGAKHQKLLRITKEFVRSHWNFTRMFCGDRLARLVWAYLLVYRVEDCQGCMPVSARLCPLPKKCPDCLRLMVLVWRGLTGGNRGKILSPAR